MAMNQEALLDERLEGILKNGLTDRLTPLDLPGHEHFGAERERLFHQLLRAERTFFEVPERARRHLIRLQEAHQNRGVTLEPFSARPTGVPAAGDTALIGELELRLEAMALRVSSKMLSNG